MANVMAFYFVTKKKKHTQQGAAWDQALFVSTFESIPAGIIA